MEEKEIQEIVNAEGKVTNTITYEKGKTTTIRGIETADGEETSLTTIEYKDQINGSVIHNGKFDTDTIKTFISQLNDLVND